MADALEEVEVDYDDYGHQGCYVFKSSTLNEHDNDDRPKKKRKTTKPLPTPVNTWPKLCGGAEPLELTKLRQKTFQSTWGLHESKIQEIVKKIDVKALGQLKDFLKSGGSRHGRVKTGLIVSGPDNRSQAGLLDHLRNEKEDSYILLEVHSGQAPNLQTTLKNVIRMAIENHAGQDEYNSFLAANKRLVPLPFDLDLLLKYINQNGIERIIISIADAETLDLAVLADLLSSLSSWSDRIPFILLLGIATTVDLFESRLSQSTIRLLEATTFDITSNSDKPYDILCAVQCDPNTKLYLDLSSINALFELTQEQATTINTFVRALKYIYMTHFFANSLSALLSQLSDKIETSTLCESIRNTQSFQRHCQSLLKEGKVRAETVRQLLNNDGFLLTQTQSAIRSGIDFQRRTNELVQYTVKLYKYLNNTTRESSLSLHAQLLHSFSATPTESEIHQTIMDKLKVLPSDDMITTIFEFPELFTKASSSTLSQLTTSISKLHTKHSVSSIKSNNFHAVPTNSNLTFQKANGISKPSDAEKAYTAIIDSTISKVSEFLTNARSSSMENNITTTTVTTPSPPMTFMHEAFLYSSAYPVKQTFQPRPRAALERALSKPSDYLGCTYCSTTQTLNSRTNHGESPKEATSILYNLLTEAGRDVNVRDLWDAFQDTIGSPTATLKTKTATPAGADSDDSNDEQDAEQHHHDSNNNDDNDDDEQTHKQTLTQFYTSLSHLKMLGLIMSKAPSENAKGMAKGVDVISRVTWSGL